MRIFAVLAVLFTVVPLVELSLLLWLSQLTSPWWTLAFVILTGLLGAFVARQQSWNLIAHIVRQARDGRPIQEAIVDGVLLLIAAVLLITPGVLTDLTGLLLLLPGVRGWVGRLAIRHVTARAKLHVQTHFRDAAMFAGPGFGSDLPPNPAAAPQPNADPQVIDAEFRRVS